MSTTAAPPRAHEHRVAEPGGSLTGTGTLLRFMLRRDRVRLPAWTLGLTALLAYFANALPVIFEMGGSLEGLTAFARNPAMALIGGPGFGFDDVTLPRFLVGMYGVFVMLGAAFMSITTVSRHTRVEEQTGRGELVRANVVGRPAQLTAALVVAVGMNLVITVLMGAALVGSQMDPEPASSAFLFAASIGAVGLVFAAVAAVTVQLSPFPRAASGIAGAVLGAAFMVRGPGGHVRRSGRRARVALLALPARLVPADRAVHPRPVVAAPAQRAGLRSARRRRLHAAGAPGPGRGGLAGPARRLARPRVAAQPARPRLPAAACRPGRLVGGHARRRAGLRCLRPTDGGGRGGHARRHRRPHGRVRGNHRRLPGVHGPLLRHHGHCLRDPLAALP